jgi:hypothetical protein
VFNHHKKTGGIEICCADNSFRRPKTLTSPIRQRLHCTVRGRSYISQCSDSKSRKDISTIASDLTHVTERPLEASWMLGARACEKQQKAELGIVAICTEDLHYTTRQKNIVSRCAKSNNHSRGAVHNPTITELCAEFFA